LGVVAPPLVLVALTALAFLQGGDNPVAYLIFDGIAVLIGVPCMLARGVERGHGRRPLGGVAGHARLEARSLATADGAVVPLDDLTGVAIRQPNPLLKWRVLEATRAEGGPVVLAHRVSVSRYAQARTLAAELGERLGVPVDIPADVQTGDMVGLGDKHAAAFCYLPLQGIFLLASLWYVFQAKDRPFVRFAAVQSLLQVVVSTGVLLGLVAVSAALAWAQDAGLLPEPVLIAALLVLWGIFFAWHVGSRIIATVAAWTGRPVVFPWLWPVLAKRRPAPI